MSWDSRVFTTPTHPHPLHSLAPNPGTNVILCPSLWCQLCHYPSSLPGGIFKYKESKSAFVRNVWFIRLVFYAVWIRAFTVWHVKMPFTECHLKQLHIPCSLYHQCFCPVSTSWVYVVCMHDLHDLSWHVIYFTTQFNCIMTVQILPNHAITVCNILLLIFQIILLVPLIM